MAYIADLMVKISAHTKSFDAGIAATGKALGTLQTASKSAISTIVRLDTLTADNLSTNLTVVAADMAVLQAATAATLPWIDAARQKLSLMAAACGLTAGAMRLFLGVQSTLTIGLTALTSRLEYLWSRLGAVRSILGPMVSVFGTIGAGVMAVTYPLRVMGGLLFTISKPFLSIAMSVMMFKLSLKTLGIQLSWVKQLLGVLPLKVKLLLGAFLAAGVVVNSFGVVGRVAAKALSLLLIPIVALRSPTAALKLAAIQAGQGFAMMATAVRATSTAIKSTAIGAVKGLGSALMSIPRAAGRAISGMGMLAGMGAGAALGGMVKLAADAESLQLQFKVLTGSSETAATVMGKLDAFAAETPFQKMEIGQAARQLIAFGSNADTVFNEMRMIGDIAAATGQPIGELAELYGKAKVQGRLFGEDINQLTGRGIPIIQALAAQMGVADSEVKKLVADGSVGFPEMQKAMASMVGPTGKFGGMMQELSQTTAGKWSTFVDNVFLMGTALGNEVLPYANQLMDWATSMMGGMDGVGTAFGAALKTGVDFGTKVLQGVYDVGTVAGVVAGNFGTVWEAVFQELPKYASAAFDWISTNAGIMIDNIKAMASNVGQEAASGASLAMQGLAFRLGLGDMPNAAAEMNKFKPMEAMKAFEAFKTPEAGAAAKDLGNQINAALDANAAARIGGEAAKAVIQKTALGDLGPAGASTAGGDSDRSSGRGQQQEAKFSGALQKGSAEAYSAIFSNRSKDVDRQVTATNKVASVISKEVGQPIKQLVNKMGAEQVAGAFG